MKRRPSVLALRALNQYRRRDVISYLGLRYYLNNAAAQSDAWARNLTTRLVLTRSSRPYFKAHHFKEMTHDAGVKHRAMFLPAPNEALAETALLDECSKRPNAFSNPSCVFSYHLASTDDLNGAFEFYSNGLKARHGGIAMACDSEPGSTVRYLDIKRFYPSIPTELALAAWCKAADAGRLPESFRALGEQLIGDYKASAPAEENGVVTGPMFSHLIANLVLRDFDNALAAKFPGRFFRYVDDMTIVGSERTIKDAEAEISSRLKDLGFALHDDDSPKSLRVPADSWLLGREDYQDKREEVSWMTLIGGLKRLLVADPSKRVEIQDKFASNGIRIPIYDYSAAAHERTYLQRLSELAKSSWFRRISQPVTPQHLLSEALTLRGRYEKELTELLASEPPSGFEKKRLVPMLRFRAGRLAYLSEPKSLNGFADSLRRYPELQFHAGVLRAIATREIDDLLAMGTNAAQAAAQPLKAANVRCKLQKAAADDAAQQSLAVFILNGVPIDDAATNQSDTELLRFARKGTDARLMRSGDDFLRELACLHGISEPRHSATLESVFDEDERLAIDAVEQLQDSASL